MSRYYFLSISIFLLLIFCFSLYPVNASLPLIGKTIIVDPGHGGVDPGTVHNEILEKDINLAISLYLEEELIKLGAMVILTRSGDYDLSVPNSTWRKRSDFDNRIELINNSGANLYLSIHLNYLNNSSYSGSQVFYNKDNIDIAEVIQFNLNENLKSDREIKEIPSDTYMYPKLNVPGVLIECGFLSNYSERSLLITNEYQKKIASVIANSLLYVF